MMTPVPGGLLYRWFGLGKLPAAVKMQIGGEQVLFEREGIPATTTFSGHIPGYTAGVSKQLHRGAFIVTDRRVIGTCGRSKAVDVPYDLQRDGPAMRTLESDGLHILWDLDRLHPAYRGSAELHFKGGDPRHGARAGSGAADHLRGRPTERRAIPRQSSATARRLT
jgi:hypothetical protein